MRTEAIARLVGRLERERDEALRQVRYIDRKRYEDREALYREFDLRTRQMQAMNEHLLGLVSRAAALDMSPLVIKVLPSALREGREGKVPESGSNS